MSAIDVARGAVARSTRISAPASELRGISRARTICATWAEIVVSALALSRALEGTALALSRALEGTAPRQRAKLAAGWLELLQARRI
jgi:hypothetical protein